MYFWQVRFKSGKVISQIDSQGIEVPYGDVLDRMSSGDDATDIFWCLQTQSGLWINIASYHLESGESPIIFRRHTFNGTDEVNSYILGKQKEDGSSEVVELPEMSSIITLGK